MTLTLMYFFRKIIEWLPHDSTNINTGWRRRWARHVLLPWSMISLLLSLLSLLLLMLLNISLSIVLFFLRLAIAQVYRQVGQLKSHAASSTSHSSIIAIPVIGFVIRYVGSLIKIRFLMPWPRLLFLHL